MRYDNTNYYFLKNEFGDIMYVCRADNDQIYAKYSYDAWGRCEVETDLNGIAYSNPFRYRGYFMDSETGYYYLQTRYYDPMLRRFISTDNYELTTSLSPGELNMFAYCGNNPVMKTDKTGEFGIVTSIILGMLLSGVISGIMSGIKTGSGENFWGNFWGGFVNGAINGLGLAIGVARAV